MKVYLDTNVVMEFITQRELYKTVRKIMRAAEAGICTYKPPKQIYWLLRRMIMMLSVMLAPFLYYFDPILPHSPHSFSADSLLAQILLREK